MQEIVRGMASHRPIALQLASDPCPGAQAPRRLGCPPPEVEKPAVQGLQQSHGASALVVQGCQRTGLSFKGGQALGQGIKRLVPGNALPATFGPLEWV